MQADLSNFSKQYRTYHGEEWDLCPEDRQWLTEIRCHKQPGGYIFTVGEELLGYCSELGAEHGYLRAKLTATPGVVMAQEGDQEFIAHFSVKMLDQIAGMVGAIKKRHISDEDKTRLIAQLRSKNHLKSDPEN